MSMADDETIDSSVVLEAVDGVSAARPPRPRAWLTVALTLLIFAVYAIAQSLVIGVFLAGELSRNPNLDVDAWLERVQFDGRLLAAGTIVAAAVTLPLVLLAARWASGPAAREHLGLRALTAGSVVQWLMILAAYLAVVYAVQWLAGREQVPEFMEEVYKTAGLSAPLLIAIVLVAPLSEELLFRGFLYGGLAPTAIRPIGAAIISSLAWAVIHVQYDLFTIGTIFVAGLLLAAARQRTQSVMVCVIMHAAMNLAATIELAIVMAERA
jgi:uncharacterized protein